MGRSIYVGVDGKARKVRRVYVGVDGKARKVRKVFIGVNGVARQCYSADPEVVYYGELEDLSLSRSADQGASAGSYAVFAGGRNNSVNYSNVVDAYSSNLVHSTPTTLTSGRWGTMGATLGNYAIFTGGREDNGDNAYNRSSRVDVYDSNLTRSSATSLPQSRNGHAIATVGDYALVAGGILAGNSFTNTVITYNKSLTRGTASSIATSGYGMAGASNASYALIAGGRNSSSIDVANVDAYNSSLVKTTTTDLTAATTSLTGAGNSKYAIFLSNKFKGVDMYNTALVKTTAAEPSSYSGSNSQPITLEDHIIFGKSYLQYYDVNMVYRKVAGSKYTGYTVGAVAGSYAILHESTNASGSATVHCCYVVK